MNYKLTNLKQCNSCFLSVTLTSARATDAGNCFLAVNVSV